MRSAGPGPSVTEAPPDAAACFLTGKKNNRGGCQRRGGCELSRRRPRASAPPGCAPGAPRAEPGARTRQALPASLPALPGAPPSPWGCGQSRAIPPALSPRSGAGSPAPLCGGTDRFASPDRELRAPAVTPGEPKTPPPPPPSSKRFACHLFPAPRSVSAKGVRIPPELGRRLSKAKAARDLVTALSPRTQEALGSSAGHPGRACSRVWGK